MKDLYQVLGVQENASDEEIKKAYRGLAKANHPDATGGDAKKTERFKEVGEAYGILGDKGKRGEYDRLRHAPVGMDGMPQGFDPQTFADIFGNANMGRGGGQTRVHFSGGGFGDIGDVFSSLFGGAGGGQNPWNRGAQAARGSDMSARLDLPFAEAIVGGQHQVRTGSGKTIDVTIPPGVESGGRLRISRQGGPAPGGKGTPGDLYLDIEVTPHRHLRRVGDDVELDVPITVTEAVLGARIEVPTVEGPVWVVLPPGTSSGRRLRLRGKGVRRSDDSRGDQFCRVQVMVPTLAEADKESRRLIEEFDKRTKGESVRNFQD